MPTYSPTYSPTHLPTCLPLTCRSISYPLAYIGLHPFLPPCLPSHLLLVCDPKLHMHLLYLPACLTYYIFSSCFCRHAPRKTPCGRTVEGRRERERERERVSNRETHAHFPRALVASRHQHSSLSNLCYSNWPVPVVSSLIMHLQAHDLK